MKTIDLSKVREAVKNSTATELTPYMWEILLFLSKEVVTRKGIIQSNQDLGVTDKELDAAMDICTGSVNRLRRQYARNVINTTDEDISALQLVKYLRTLVTYAYLDYKAFVYRGNERKTRSTQPDVVEFPKGFDIVGDDEDSIIAMIDEGLL